MESIVFATKGPRIEALNEVIMLPGTVATWLQSGTITRPTLTYTSVAACRTARLVVIESSEFDGGINTPYPIGAPTGQEWLVSVIAAQPGDMFWLRATSSIGTGGERVRVDSLGGTGELITTFAADQEYLAFGYTMGPSELIGGVNWVKVQVSGN